MLAIGFALLTLAFLSAEALRVNRCKEVPLNENLIAVTILPANTSPFFLIRGHNVTLQQRVVVDSVVERPILRVSATIKGQTFYFGGVDGSSICSDIYDADDTKSSCPLQLNHEYIYKKQFFIHFHYPAIILRVHWSMIDETTTVPFTCWKLMAVITDE